MTAWWLVDFVCLIVGFSYGVVVRRQWKWCRRTFLLRRWRMLLLLLVLLHILMLFLKQHSIMLIVASSCSSCWIRRQREPLCCCCLFVVVCSRRRAVWASCFCCFPPTVPPCWKTINRLCFLPFNMDCTCFSRRKHRWSSLQHQLLVLGGLLRPHAKAARNGATTCRFQDHPNLLSYRENCAFKSAAVVSRLATGRRNPVSSRFWQRLVLVVRSVLWPLAEAAKNGANTCRFQDQFHLLSCRDYFTFKSTAESSRLSTGRRSSFSNRFLQRLGANSKRSSHPLPSECIGLSKCLRWRMQVYRLALLVLCISCCFLIS